MSFPRIHWRRSNTIKRPALALRNPEIAYFYFIKAEHKAEVDSIIVLKLNDSIHEVIAQISVNMQTCHFDAGLLTKCVKQEKKVIV